jgi:hypothetical protein
MLRSTRLLKDRVMTEGSCFLAWMARFLSSLELTRRCPGFVSYGAAMLWLGCMRFPPHFVQKGVVTVVPHCPQREYSSLDPPAFLPHWVQKGVVTFVPH